MKTAWSKSLGSWSASCLCALTVLALCQSCAEKPPEQPKAAAPTMLRTLGGGPQEQAPPPEPEMARPNRGELLSQPLPQMQQGGGAPPQDAMQGTGSGLQYQDLVPGNGQQPMPGQTVVVNYTGWLTNGSKFDSSLDKGQPFQFVLGQGEVIQGWDEGVSTMRVGGKRRLIIPPHLGYGDRGAGGVIPPGATLVFEVDLLGVQ